ncbi:MAG TPA: FMN-binding protein [Bacteroidetes bacterium]|nr:FMN-binding protein [Bacteroidota bacterium]
MSKKNPIQKNAQTGSLKMLWSMAGIGLICAFLIVMTYEGTLPRIERLKAEALEKAIFKVIPGMTKKRTFKLDENNNFIEISSDEKDAQLVYAGYDDNDKLLGIAVPASGMGFADILHILYGYDPNKQAVVGFYVLESKETPGLGDKIEKDENFLANFAALDVALSDGNTTLKNKVVTVKHGAKKNNWEIDGITGATISSRAIGNIMGESTEQMVPLIFKNIEVFK